MIGPSRPAGPPRSPDLVVGAQHEASWSITGHLRPAVENVGPVREQRARSTGHTHLNVGQLAKLDAGAPGEILETVELAFWPVRVWGAGFERYDLGWSVFLVDVRQQD